MFHYLKKSIIIYIKKIDMLFLNLLQWINKRILKTYPLIEDCARCRDCGRNVHDFNVPDYLWEKVVNNEIVLCYDCFCDRANRKLGIKNRMTVVEWK